MGFANNMAPGVSEEFEKLSITSDFREKGMLNC